MKAFKLKQKKINTKIVIALLLSIKSNKRMYDIRLLQTSHRQICLQSVNKT